MGPGHPSGPLTDASGFAIAVNDDGRVAVAGSVTGALEPGVAGLSIGTSAALRQIVPEPRIDPEGRLIYVGGIDDRPTNKVEDLDGANNFVRAALAEGGPDDR